MRCVGNQKMAGFERTELVVKIIQPIWRVGLECGLGQAI